VELAQYAILAMDYLEIVASKDYLKIQTAKLSKDQIVRTA